MLKILSNFISESLGQEMSTASAHGANALANPEKFNNLDLIEILDRSCGKIDMPLEIGLRKFGEYSFAKFVAFLPPTLKISSARDFILNVQDLIYPEIRKKFPDIDLPKIRIQEKDDDLFLHYESHNQLCYFVEGLILGCAAHFSTSMGLEQVHCTHGGDESCIFHIEF